MPRKAVGRQPPRIGPLWEAFCDYWQDAPDGKGRCATAWRAFFAGYMNGLGAAPGIQRTPGLSTEGSKGRTQDGSNRGA